MTQRLIQVPKLGDPSPFVCGKCDLSFANTSPEDQSKIHRHLILHVPDSTARWSLMDAWLAEENARNDTANATFS